MRSRRRSQAGRAIGIDAEPYRGRLVQDRGPRVGIVNHGGRAQRPRYLVRDSLVEHRHSVLDGRLTDMGVATTPEWKRASLSHDYRRGFTAGVVVTASAASVLMLVGFIGMGGIDALGSKLQTAAQRGDDGAPYDDRGDTSAANATPAGEPLAGGPRVPARESDDQRRLREEDELRTEDVGGRDLGLDELVRARQHNRKVLERGDSMFKTLLGRGDDDSAQ